MPRDSDSIPAFMAQMSGRAARNYAEQGRANAARITAQEAARWAIVYLNANNAWGECPVAPVNAKNGRRA